MGALAARAADAPARPKVWPDTEETARLLNGIATTVPGSSVAAPPREYDRAHLAEGLGADAARYLDYDVRWAAVITYKSATPELGTIRLEVLSFGSDLDAFGSFALGRKESVTPALFENSSFWLGSELRIWRGPWYLRIVPSVTGETSAPAKAKPAANGAPQGGSNVASNVAATGSKLATTPKPTPAETARVACAKLAEALLAAVPDAPPAPALVGLLPEANLRPYSVKFARHSVLGQAALHDGLLAEYGEDLPAYYLPPPGQKRGFPRTGTMRLTLLEGADLEDARAMYAALQTALLGGDTATTVHGLGNEAVSFRSRENGKVLVFRVENYAAAISGYDRPRAAEGLARLLGTSIRIMLNAR